jgi:hypothetical protein
MMQQNEFIKTRFVALAGEIDIERKKGSKILSCNHIVDPEFKTVV